MRAFLVQHADAKPKDEDPDRPLTDRGRRDAEKIAEHLRGLDMRVKELWHSGKTRAAQTAETLAAAMTVDGGVTVRDDMAPDAKPGPVAKAIGKAGGDLLLVGHMPFMARLAGKLIAGKASAAPVAFSKGGVVCLQRDDDAWQVAWMITPESLGASCEGQQG